MEPRWEKRDSGFSGLGFQGTGFKTFVSEDSPRKTPLGSRACLWSQDFLAVRDAWRSLRVEIYRRQSPSYDQVVSCSLKEQ